MCVCLHFKPSHARSSTRLYPITHRPCPTPLATTYPLRPCPSILRARAQLRAARYPSTVPGLESSGCVDLVFASGSVLTVVALKTDPGSVAMHEAVKGLWMCIPPVEDASAAPTLPSKADKPKKAKTAKKETEATSEATEGASPAKAKKKKKKKKKDEAPSATDAASPAKAKKAKKKKDEAPSATDAASPAKAKKAKKKKVKATSEDAPAEATGKGVKMVVGMEGKKKDKKASEERRPTFEHVGAERAAQPEKKKKTKKKKKKEKIPDPPSV